MSEDENKRIVRRLVEEFQSGHTFEVGEERTGDDFIDRTPRPGESGNEEDSGCRRAVGPALHGEDQGTPGR